MRLAFRMHAGQFHQCTHESSVPTIHGLSVLPVFVHQHPGQHQNCYLADHVLCYYFSGPDNCRKHIVFELNNVILVLMYLSSCWLKIKGNALNKYWYCSKCLCAHYFSSFTECWPIFHIIQMEPASYLLMHQTIQSVWIQPTFNWHQSFFCVYRPSFPGVFT